MGPREHHRREEGGGRYGRLSGTMKAGSLFCVVLYGSPATSALFKLYFERLRHPLCSVLLAHVLIYRIAYFIFFLRRISETSGADFEKGSPSRRHKA